MLVISVSIISFEKVVKALPPALLRALYELSEGRWMSHYYYYYCCYYFYLQL